MTEESLEHRNDFEMFPKSMMKTTLLLTTVHGARGQILIYRTLLKMKKRMMVMERHHMVFVPGRPKVTVLRPTVPKNNPSQNIDTDNRHDPLE
jgi:hypothetical protein